MTRLRCWLQLPLSITEYPLIAMKIRYSLLAVSRKGNSSWYCNMKSWQRALLSPSPHLLTFAPKTSRPHVPLVVRLSRHAYAAARSGSITRDLSGRLGNLSLVSSCTCAHLHSTTWDWNQESACIMSLDSGIRRCNARPIEVCRPTSLGQDKLPCRILRLVCQCLSVSWVC